MSVMLGQADTTIELGSGLKVATGTSGSLGIFRPLEA